MNSPLTLYISKTTPTVGSMMLRANSGTPRRYPMRTLVVIAFVALFVAALTVVLPMLKLGMDVVSALPI